jgi:orotidine-5'-phosphate decarboxylase
MSAEEKLIVALDSGDLESASAVVRGLEGLVKNFKIGGYLFTSCGHDALRMAASAGAGIFLDLKLHDIPSTVENVSGVIRGLGVKMFTVHAGGGSLMMRAAVRSAKAGSGPLVIAVTVLTHFDSAMLNELGVERGLEEHVIALAGLALDSGVDGIVCSPREISSLRKTFGQKPIIVTPGIRPEGAVRDDQTRTFTPAMAVSEGADYIVVGRPITRAPDQRRAAEEIIRSIDGK